MKIKLMIADDHSIMREGLKQLLELDEELSVIMEADDGLDCMEKLRKGFLPDVLLLDINMPNMNGLEVIQQIHKEKIDVKILVLTVHNEVEYLIKTVEYGIDGYVLKDSNSEILKKAIFTVYNGETYMQPDLIPFLNQKLIAKNEDQILIESLTNREVEVLKLLSVGLFNKEIGEQLSISERTVKNHISSIFKKLSVSDRTQAAVFAIRNNLINVF